MGASYSGNVVSGGTPPADAPGDAIAARRMIIAKLKTHVSELQERIVTLEQEGHHATNRMRVTRDRNVTYTANNDMLQQQIGRLQRAVEMGDKRCEDLLSQVDTVHERLLEIQKTVTKLTELNCTQEYQLYGYRKVIAKLEKKVELANLCIVEKDKLLNE
jgi:chromosome segregation ATPase